MSVHQAKGLEFPIVVLWDACGTWAAADRAPIFVVDPSRGEWALRVHGLKWEEPAGSGLLDREQEQADWERRRIVYVAATRARDIFVVPRAPPGTKFDRAEKHIHAMLAEVGSSEVCTADTYVRESLPKWVVPQSGDREIATATAIDEEVQRTWTQASDAAKVSRWRPAGVAAHAKEQVRLRASEAEVEAPDTKRREGRYGPLFGDTVHRAIGLALTKKLAPIEAVGRSARATGLREHLTEAGMDVVRALEALGQAGLSTATTIRLEYPVGMVEAGRLLTGYVDLVASVGDRAIVIDFKTDRAPKEAARDSYPQYVAQVAAYVQMLAAAGVAGNDLRGGLLWTETGTIEWL
jgi:ATP-dependent helicase/nuclease subunit A